MSSMRMASVGMAVAVLLALGARAAAAAPLPDAECRTLAAEHAAMLASGIEETLEKGPEWATTNLNPDEFERIFDFLRIEEQVRFRCPDVDLAIDLEKEAESEEAAAPSGPSVPLPLRRPEAPRQGG